MSLLSDLYQEVILDHNRRPRNYGELADATNQAEGHNPLCGDRVSVFLRRSEDIIEKVAFVGTGCAISATNIPALSNGAKRGCVVMSQMV